MAAPAAAPHAVTKIAPSWEPVIAPSAAAVKTVTKVEPELDVVVKEKPFTPMPEGGRPDDAQGQEIGGGLAETTTTPRTKTPRSEGTVVRRSVNLETGEEEIEVLDAGELAVARYSRGPGPQPQLSVGEQDDHDGRTGPRFDATAEAPQETSPVLA